MLSRCALLLLFALGCSDDDERPPVQACPDCVGSSGTQPGEGGGEAGAGGDDGAGAAGAAATDFAVTRFESDTFDARSVFAEQAQVWAEARGGGTVKTTWPGGGSIELAGAQPQGFVLVIPPSSGVDALATLLQPAWREPLEELPLVRASVVELIASLSTQPLELLPERAQVVLRLRDAATDLPVAGVTFDEGTAETVIYAADNSWSDAVDVTGPRGLALLVNVAAAAWPGRLGAVTVSGTLLGSVPFRAVPGAVTFLDVRVTR